MTSLLQAHQAAQHGMQAALDFAERDDPAFREKVLAHIERYASIHPEFTGEACNDEMVLLGIVPKERLKGTGSLYVVAQRLGLIVRDGYAPRRKGHTAPGAKYKSLVCQVAA